MYDDPLQETNKELLWDGDLPLNCGCLRREKEKGAIGETGMGGNGLADGIGKGMDGEGMYPHLRGENLGEKHHTRGSAGKGDTITNVEPIWGHPARAGCRATGEVVLDWDSLGRGSSSNHWWGGRMLVQVRSVWTRGV